MDKLIKEIVKIGFLESPGQKNEAVHQFLSMIQQVVDLSPLESGMSGIEDVCKELLRVIIEETNFENCSIMLWDSEIKLLRLFAAFGLKDLIGNVPLKPYNRDLAFAPSEGIAGEVFVTQDSVFVENSTFHAIPAREGAAIATRALACLPLHHIGVLNISSTTPRIFTTSTRRNLELMSKMISCVLLVAFSRARFDASLPWQGTREEGVVRAENRSPSFDEAPLLERVINNAPFGLCILDASGNVLQFNNVIVERHGENVRRALGRSPSVLFQDSGVFRDLIEKAASLGKEELASVPLVSANGEMYLADVHLVGLSEKDGQPTGYLLMINDVSQKKAFSEKILQTEKLAALGTMAGGVAHDFNNLLMAILGNIQLILPQINDEKVHRRLQNIEKAVYDGANTVRRLQKFNDRNANALVPRVVVDMDEAISDVIELTRPRWKNAMERHGHSIQFLKEIEPECRPAIHASDLREVLTNFTLNAIEAMPEGGSITFRCRSSNGEIIIEIQDAGVGMSEEVASKIFDPFYTTKGVGNSGLGLSVSWSLISRAQGEVHVKSKPGKGTVFVIRLPKAEAQSSHQTHSEAVELNRSHRLLVVDDDVEVLGILRDMLCLKGHRVTATNDASKALELIVKDDFDLVLTDLGMPSVNGWEIAKSVKAKNPKVPVVLITGWGAQYEEDNITSKGVDLLLSKPLSWDKLLLGIERLL